ncbi:MAG: DUF3656 domain-containing protein [Clostridia bacterium]|nr:DUF3656 domain-containing protein [Clostridia bacterium]
MKENNRPEVLAPAGSREALEAAVRSGADAVYLGATAFSARRQAENFGEEAFAEAVRYCRLRGVKVYQTLNIMLFERELQAALAVAERSVAAGVDGFIIQDLGLAKLLHAAFPTVPMHASTQLSVHSAAALKPLKTLGFCRVVAAREMSREELKTLCRSADSLGMTVEVFVHGALCMSVSGQCLLSAVLGGRSGNRGLCAGPCRLPFAVSGGTGYDLSLKDLSLLSYIDELADMGVASLKIEGRMKRPEYVAAATFACRQAVENGAVPERLSEMLGRVFSRSGFTDGYYTANRGKTMFGVRTKEDVTAAGEAFPYIHELYRNERQSVAVTARMTCEAGKPVGLTVSDGAHTISVSGPVPGVAQNRPLDQRTVADALTQTGGTPYCLTVSDITLGEGLFLRAAQLKELRRRALEELSAARSVVLPRTKNKITLFAGRHPAPERPAVVARFASAAQIPEETDGLTAILLPAEEPWTGNLPKGIPLGADVPRGAAEDAQIRRFLEARRQEGASFAYCGNLSAVETAKEAGLAVCGGLGLNVSNSQSIAVLQEMGLSAVTLSAECGLRDAVSMPSELPKGIFAYGKLPLMLTRNCPVANGGGCTGCRKDRVLTDRKGVSFPVRCRNGFSQVFNPLPVWLADRLSETKGLDYLLLWFTDESPAQAAEVLRAYRNGGQPPQNGFTRGLLYRTVL